MQRTLGINFSGDLQGATAALSAASQMAEGGNCCPSTGMAEFLREHLPDEFLLTAKGSNILRGYWCITKARQQAIAMEFKCAGKKYPQVIRLAWESPSSWEKNFLLLPASFASCHQCMRVPLEGISYQAEIGWLSDEGDFIPVLRSNESDCSKNLAVPLQEV